MKLCTVEGCGKRRVARGWCRKHYTRWHQHGDVNVQKKPQCELMAYVLNVVETHSSDECHIWPFGKTSGGYGVIGFEGQRTTVNRVVCQLKHGPAPAGRPFSAHRCGNSLCINPAHLRWATAAENEADKRSHGTIQRGELRWNSKLTPEKVAQIRQLCSTLGTKDIAQRFGIHYVTVGKVLRRETWKHV